MAYEFKIIAFIADLLNFLIQKSHGHLASIVALSQQQLTLL